MNESPQLSPILGAAAAHPPRVLYIAGSGRSGSTLLERILGSLTGAVNVGELIELFRTVWDQQELCGCGQQFSDCSFWRGVGRHAFGGWDAEIMRSVARLQRHVSRQRHFPRLLATAAAGPGFRSDLRRYGEEYRRIYTSALAVAGANMVVDASKWPAQGLALLRSGLFDLRVIHLIRDPRGVAYSWTKSGVLRPQAGNDRPFMATHKAGRTAVRWLAFQAECAALTQLAPHATHIRYEDLVRSPRRVLTEALIALDLPELAESLDSVGDHDVLLHSSHGLAGNPSRFKCGRVELRPDERWRQSMPTASRVTTTAVTLPALVAYGYVGPKAKR